MSCLMKSAPGVAVLRCFFLYGTKNNTKTKTQQKINNNIKKIRPTFCIDKKSELLFGVDTKNRADTKSQTDFCLYKILVRLFVTDLYTRNVEPIFFIYKNTRERTYQLS